MSLEEWSFVAQIVSAVVVIASLIFVGFQLRRATDAIRAASSDAYSNLHTHLAQSIVDNPAFAGLWSRGLADPRSLNEEEWVRFVAAVATQFRIWESTRVQWLRGRLDDEHWRFAEQQAMTLGSQPGVAAVWKLRGHWYSPEFRAWFDGLKTARASQLYSRH